VRPALQAEEEAGVLPELPALVVRVVPLELEATAARRGFWDSVPWVWQTELPLHSLVDSQDWAACLQRAAVRSLRGRFGSLCTRHRSYRPILSLERRPSHLHHCQQEQCGKSSWVQDSLRRVEQGLDAKMEVRKAQAERRAQGVQLEQQRKPKERQALRRP